MQFWKENQVSCHFHVIFNMGIYYEIAVKINLLSPMARNQNLVIKVVFFILRVTIISNLSLLIKNKNLLNKQTA